MNDRAMLRPDRAKRSRYLWLLVVLLLTGCATSAATPITVYVTPAPAVETATPEPAFVDGGTITFGTEYNADLFIDKPLTRFKRTIKTIAWSAVFTRAANATSVEWIVASQSASGSERVVVKRDVEMSNPEADLIANDGDLAFVLDNKAGTYVMRYIESGDILAEGTFTLVK